MFILHTYLTLPPLIDIKTQEIWYLYYFQAEISGKFHPK